MSLRFDPKVPTSNSFRNLLKGLLSDAEHRLGRESIQQIKGHAFFDDVNWESISTGLAIRRLPLFFFLTPSFFTPSS